VRAVGQEEYLVVGGLDEELAKMRVLALFLLLSNIYPCLGFEDVDIAPHVDYSSEETMPFQGMYAHADVEEDTRPKISQKVVIEKEYTDKSSFSCNENLFQGIDQQLSFNKLLESAETYPMLDSTASRQSCSFVSNPRPPGDNLYRILNTSEHRAACKVFASYSDGKNFVCSGSMVGPHHFLTARHCTYRPCASLVSAKIACGYSYAEDDTGEPVESFAHFGTARLIGCVRYKAYDDAQRCRTGNDIHDDYDATRDFDIQVCRVDREMPYSIMGYAIARSSFARDSKAYGYPVGSDTDLSSYFDHLGDVLVGRNVSQFAFNDRHLQLDGIWMFGGDSGAMQFHNDYVFAVMTRSVPGCFAISRFIDVRFYDTIANALSTSGGFPKPVAFCQVIPYPIDAYENYPDESIMNGFRVGGSNVRTTSVFQDDVILLNFKLFNVGNKDANLIARLYRSDDEDISTVDVLVSETSLLVSNVTTASYLWNVTVAWTGSQHLGIVWTSTNGCKADDISRQYIGQVVSRVAPAPTSSPSLVPSLEPAPDPSLEPTLEPLPSPGATDPPLTCSRSLFGGCGK